MSRQSKIVSDFNGFLDKATSPNQLEPNHDAIINLCAMIDNNKIKPGDAVQAIHGKIVDVNPHTVLFALKLLEVVFLKCGNIIHNVVCTPQYMDLLKDIIKTTEHKKIKDTIIIILENWADLLKFFPKYCEPKKLLDSLKASDQNTDNGFQTSVSLTKTNTTVKDNDEYKSSIMEYQKIKNREFKNYLKSQGLHTSSDEEDYIKMQRQNYASNNNNCQGNIEQSLFKTKKLPKDLENTKKQRHRLNNETQRIRQLHHKNYVENSGKHTSDLSLCQDSNCIYCKKKDDSEEFLTPKPHLCYEMRKIKESKEKLKKEFDEYKTLKKQSYYSNKPDIGSDYTSSKPQKNAMTKVEIEEDFKKAILSQMETDHRSKSDLTIQHQELSLEEKELQQAISLSLAESENSRNIPVSDLDNEDIQISFAKQLSLKNDNANNEKTDSGHYNNIIKVGLCRVCYTRDLLKRFEPCKHEWLCEECAETYKSQKCPSCDTYYTSIVWNM